MPFTLPPLPYPYEALEPSIDKLTMQIHHDKHHQAYVDNLNKAIAGTPHENKTIEQLLAEISKLPIAVRNNGGGHWNHSFFWNILSPNAQQPQGKIAAAINTAFGSLDTFKEKFAQAATARFGSGWAWLILRDGKLEITSTPNQDNPLMDIAEVKGKPIIGIDVWEHAYYLKYQNKRADYIAAFWDRVNWNKASELFEQ